MTGRSREAYGKILEKKGIMAGVYSFPVIKPRADKAIADIIAKYDFIVTIEEHTVIGAFGSSITELASKFGKAVKIEMIGIQDEFATLVGDRNNLRKQYRMDAESIAKAVIKALK